MTRHECLMFCLPTRATLLFTSATLLEAKLQRGTVLYVVVRQRVFVGEEAQPGEGDLLLVRRETPGGFLDELLELRYDTGELRDVTLRSTVCPTRLSSPSTLGNVTLITPEPPLSARKSSSVSNSISPTFRFFDAGACLLYTSPSPRDRSLSRMPSSA